MPGGVKTELQSFSAAQTAITAGARPSRSEEVLQPLLAGEAAVTVEVRSISRLEALDDAIFLRVLSFSPVISASLAFTCKDINKRISKEWSKNDSLKRLLNLNLALTDATMKDVRGLMAQVAKGVDVRGKIQSCIQRHQACCSVRIPSCYTLFPSPLDSYTRRELNRMSRDGSGSQKLAAIFGSLLCWVCNGLSLFALSSNAALDTKGTVVAKVFVEIILVLLTMLTTCQTVLPSVMSLIMANNVSRLEEGAVQLPCNVLRLSDSILCEWEFAPELKDLIKRFISIDCDYETALEVKTYGDVLAALKKPGQTEKKFESYVNQVQHHSATGSTSTHESYAYRRAGAGVGAMRTSPAVIAAAAAGTSVIDEGDAAARGYRV